MKRIILCVMTAALLAGCVRETDPYSLYDKAAEGFDGEIIQAVLGKRAVDNAEIVSEQQSALMDSAFENINIGGSVISLPVMVSDLPEGFVTEYQTELTHMDGYGLYTAALECGGEDSTDVFVVKSDRTDEEHGVIIGIVLDGNTAEWEIGDIRWSVDGDYLKEKWGEPSAEKDLVAEGINDCMYINGNGSTVVFFGAVNMAMVFSLDMSGLADAGGKCSYSPEETVTAADITGEKRAFPAADALKDNAVAIGKNSFAANAEIGSLGEDIMLVDISHEPYKENAEYTEDRYFLYAMGKNIGIVDALRRNDEPEEKAVIYTWEFIAEEKMLEAVSVMGIPVTQSSDSLCTVITPTREDEMFTVFDSLLYKDEVEYFVEYTIVKSAQDIIVTLEIVPTAIGSFGYDVYMGEYE